MTVTEWPASDSRPLVAHVVYRFDVGGLENGVVNLVNRLDRWRHVVISVTDIEPSFRERVRRPDVGFIALGKPPGNGAVVWPSLVRHLRQLRPSVLHSRNLAALEMQPAAWWAGVPWRVHGEHGRDADDPDGTVKRYQRIRRLYAPFVHHWVALSRDLQAYLCNAVRIAPRRVTQIYNGVDVARFGSTPGQGRVADCPFTDESLCVVGTVGRMQTVKAQPLLAEAFVLALKQQPGLRSHLRLAMVGDGPLRAECEAILASAGVRDLAWLPGERNDVPALMNSFDLFVLPSLAEGISNTILEAMASSLPVIATAVGGNADLVDDGVSGQVVPAGSVPALASALVSWCEDRERRRQAGRSGRERVERQFSLPAMVASYEAVYERWQSTRA